MDKQVILDYAQELQTNDEPWREFESLCGDMKWRECTDAVNPLTMVLNTVSEFRRKPKMVTVTMPPYIGWSCCDSNNLLLNFETWQDRDAALAAIRQAIEVGK